MFYKIKQKYLERKYRKAKSLYIICYWARYAVLEVKWSGKFDKNGEPLTIHYTDHNGEWEQYYIGSWKTETTGIIYGFTFDKQSAENIVRELNKNI